MSAQVMAAAAATTAGFLGEFVAIREVLIPSATLVGGGGSILVVSAAVLIVAPLVGGMAGGLASGRIGAVVGSIGGFYIGGFAALMAVVALDGRPFPALTLSTLLPAAVLAVPVAMGHFTGISIRPRTGQA